MIDPNTPTLDRLGTTTTASEVLPFDVLRRSLAMTAISANIPLACASLRTIMVDDIECQFWARRAIMATPLHNPTYRIAREDLVNTSMPGPVQGRTPQTHYLKSLLVMKPINHVKRGPAALGDQTSTAYACLPAATSGSAHPIPAATSYFHSSPLSSPRFVKYLFSKNGPFSPRAIGTQIGRTTLATGSDKPESLLHQLRLFHQQQMRGVPVQSMRPAGYLRATIGDLVQFVVFLARTGDLQLLELALTSTLCNLRTIVEAAEFQAPIPLEYWASTLVDNRIELRACIAALVGQGVSLSLVELLFLVAAVEWSVPMLEIVSRVASSFGSGTVSHTIFLAAHFGSPTSAIMKSMLAVVPTFTDPARFSEFFKLAKLALPSTHEPILLSPHAKSFGVFRMLLRAHDLKVVKNLAPGLEHHAHVLGKALLRWSVDLEAGGEVGREVINEIERLGVFGSAIITKWDVAQYAIGVAGLAEDSEKDHLRVLAAVERVVGVAFVDEALNMALDTHVAANANTTTDAAKLFNLLKTTRTTSPTSYFLANDRLITMSPTQINNILFETPGLEFDWLPLARHLVSHLVSLDSSAVVVATCRLASIALRVIYAHWTMCKDGAHSDALGSVRDVLAFTASCLTVFPMMDKAVHADHQWIQLSDSARQELREVLASLVVDCHRRHAEMGISTRYLATLPFDTTLSFWYDLCSIRPTIDLDPSALTSAETAEPSLPCKTFAELLDSMRFAFTGLVSLDQQFVARNIVGWHTTHVPVWVWKSFNPNLLMDMHIGGSFDLIKAATNTVDMQEMRSCAMDPRTEELAAFADWLPDGIRESAEFVGACTRSAAASGLDRCKWDWRAAQSRVG